MLFNYSPNFKMFAFAILSILFGTVVLESDFNYSTPQDPQKLTICHLEMFGMSYPYDCVRNQTPRDSINDPYCVGDNCPERMNTTCANKILNPPICPEGEYCVLPYPFYTQTAADFAKCMPAAKIGEACFTLLYSSSKTVSQMFPRCEEGLTCKRAFPAREKYLDFGVCESSDTPETSTPVTDSDFDFNYSPPQNPERLTICHGENITFDCVRNQNFSEGFEGDRFCVPDDCPERVNTTCANKLDPPYCPEGEYCVLPFPLITQTAADFAKCKPAAKIGEACSYEGDGKTPLFPWCDEGLTCQPVYTFYTPENPGPMTKCQDRHGYKYDCPVYKPYSKVYEHYGFCEEDV